jgi:hypothetical protein
VLPHQASREAIRARGRPPLVENPKERANFIDAHEIGQDLPKDNANVIDVEPLFSEKSGAISFTDKHGKQLYQDESHLSVFGANLLKPELIKAILNSEPSLKGPLMLGH